MADKVTTYQIGRATVHIIGDRDKLNMDKMRQYFGEFMTRVYAEREEREAAAKSDADTDKGA